VRACGVCVAVVLLAACGARRITLPADPGTPLADFARIHAGVSETCRGVRTLTGELGLSGRAGDDRIRGTVAAAFERPSSMRLDLRVGPLGSVVFSFVATDAGATLLLPRVQRVVRTDRAEEILAALTGLAMAPADLQAILTGCVVGSPTAIGGRRHAGGWASIDLEGGAVVYLKQEDGKWRVRAARRPDVQVEYSEWPDDATFPHRVDLHADAPVRVDLRATLSQIETNRTLESDRIFSVTVPPGTDTMTVEELRADGPLR
jgi:hypothetical protein